MQSDQDHAEVTLALDIGGTFIKSALFRGGKLIESRPQLSSRSGGSAEEIAAALRQASQGEYDAIGVAIPGPFDYRNGVSLMEHKFAAIKGRSLREFLPEMPIRFIHDANAFLLGEWRGERRLGGITLGTGLGAAAVIDGELLTNELGSPREDVSLWNKPFRGTTVELALDLRGHGPGQSMEKWLEFGKTLAEILTPWHRRFGFETIVIGGQIARDFELFRAPLAGLPVRPSADENATLSGAAAFFRREEKK